MYTRPQHHDHNVTSVRAPFAGLYSEFHDMTGGKRILKKFGQTELCDLGNEGKAITILEENRH